MRKFKTEENLWNSKDHIIELRHSELVRERWIYFFLGLGFMLPVIAFIMK